MPKKTVLHEFVAYFLLLFAVSAIFVLAPGAAFALTSYDKLAKGPIDLAKWDLYETVRVIDMSSPTEGKLQLGVRSGTATAGPVTSTLQFADPSAKTRFGATITPLDYGNADTEDPANPVSAIGGTFYNDGTSGTPDDCTGDVLGQIGVGNNPSDPANLAVYWSVVRFTSPDCSTFDILGAGGFTTPPVAVGNAYPVSMQWNGSQFSFTYDSGETQTYTPTGTINPPNTTYRGLYSMIFNGVGKEAYISSHFDNVTVDAGSYDQFNIDQINPALWTTYEFVRAIRDSEKHLVLLARGTTDSTGVTECLLPIASPDSIWTIQATVAAPILESSDDTIGHAIAGLGGRFFNDGSPGDGYVGDIGAFVRLQTSPAGLIGRWKVTRFYGASDAEQTTIAEGTAPKPIKLGKPYNMSIAWDGAKFTFIGGSQTMYYTPDQSYMANATNAKAPLKTLYSAVTDGGINAKAMGYFTNVSVAAGNTARFLTVTVSGSGTVKGSSTAIVCTGEGGHCSQAFQEGKKVVLTAKAGTGYVFNNWSGCTTTSKTVCTLIMDGSKAVTATFTSNPTLAVSPTSKKFGNVKAGLKTATATFSVTNKTTKGVTPLTIGAVTLTPDASSAGEFVIVPGSDTCSNINPPLASNKKCAFKVMFQPQSVGPKSATVTIPSDDPTTPETVIQLTGTGT